MDTGRDSAAKRYARVTVPRSCKLWYYPPISADLSEQSKHAPIHSPASRTTDVWLPAVVSVSAVIGALSSIIGVTTHCALVLICAMCMGATTRLCHLYGVRRGAGRACERIRLGPYADDKTVIYLHLRPRRCWVNCIWVPDFICAVRKEICQAYGHLRITTYEVVIKSKALITLDSLIVFESSVRGGESSDWYHRRNALWHQAGLIEAWRSSNSWGSLSSNTFILGFTGEQAQEG